MDYPTFATNQRADWAEYTNGVYHHQVFETSSVRESVRDDRCLVDYACSNDDYTFIYAPQNYDKRIRWIFEVIDWIHNDNKTTDMLAALLEGKEEDVWLWVDGDEDYIPDLFYDRLHTYEHCAAVEALQRRQQAMPRWESCRDAEVRKRVQSASFSVRIAAITWLVVSSKVMKRRDYDHGLSDRMKWNLGGSIGDWYFKLNTCGMWNDLPVASASYLERFEAAMVANGHSCHQMFSGGSQLRIARWLYIHNVLLGEIAGEVANLVMPFGYANGEVRCKGCLYYFDTHYPPEEPPSYEPSKDSVLLATLFYSRFDSRVKVIEWISRLRCSYPHLLAAGKLLSKIFTANLPEDPPDTRYLPWVNAYPQCWRLDLTDVSSETWKIIDKLSDQQIHAHTQPHPMTWLLAMLFTIATHRIRLRVDTKCQQIEDFYDHIEEIASVLFINGKPISSDAFEVPTTSAVGGFSSKVKMSLHTCWDLYNPDLYAAAVAYLCDEDDIEFVPLQQPRCKQCALACAALTFTSKVSYSSSLYSLTPELENLLCSLKYRYEESGDIALLRATFDRIVLYEKNGSSSGHENFHTAQVSVPHETVVPTLATEVTLSTTEALVSEGQERDAPRSKALDALYETEDRHPPDAPSTLTPTDIHAQVPKLKHEDMLDEVKNFLINALLKEGAFLNLNKGEFTLPWSQLRSKLVEWKIEMVNWPEEVPLKDRKKGINGLNAHFVQLLYRAIHDTERPLRFRRIIQTTAGETRKRTAGGRGKNEDEGPSTKRPHIPG